MRVCVRVNLLILTPFDLRPSSEIFYHMTAFIFRLEGL